MNKKEMGCPTPRRIGRLTVGRRINFELRTYLHREQNAWDVTGLRVPGGNKYMILHHQVGEVSKIEITKYGHESRGTQTLERLRWRVPATTENYRTHFSPERATHINNS
jgi:hypothetical protein